jgi:hypothetical protein
MTRRNVCFGSKCDLAAAACEALHLKIGDDPAARFVPEKVIELARRGIRDPDMLRKMTLKEFGLSDESASAA